MRGTHAGVWRGAAHFECMYRYNDTLVLDFSEDRIKKECFGGTFTEQRYSKTHEDWVDVQVPLINNAYVALCLWRLGCCLAPGCVSCACEWQVSGGVRSHRSAPRSRPA